MALLYYFYMNSMLWSLVCPYAFKSSLYYPSFNYINLNVQDPCRPGVKDAVRICTEAGVKVIYMYDEYSFHID